MNNDGLQNQRKLAAALRKLQTLERGRCFDPNNLQSRATPEQQLILDDIETQHRYILGGNQSGKSQLAGREISWVFTETHPNWNRPRDWHEESLLILVIGRTSQQVETELWDRKIKPFLPSGTYKEQRAGGMLQKVTHLQNGNKILFFSHHAPEEAREKLQAYVAHYVWLDEMPDSLGLLEELHRRLQAKQGRLLATFTPKIRNEAIRKLIDTPSTVHRKYNINMLDNPIYADREEELLEQMKTLPDNLRQTILYGSWYVGESAVYDFRRELHMEAPFGYTPAWRHVESIDPAASGKTGFTLWAENPNTGVWYCVKARYIDGAAASDLLPEIDKWTQGYNIVRRICDPHEVWFIKEAGKIRRHYVGVHKKNERKKELIKGLQEAISRGEVKISPDCTDLINEFLGCQWSETTADKILGASKYHLLDSAQYFVDAKPKQDKSVLQQLTFDQRLKQANQQRKVAELAASQPTADKPARIVAIRGNKWRKFF